MVATMEAPRRRTKDEVSTTKKRAELMRLAGAARQNLFDMLKLADEILKDAEYVDTFGGEAGAMDDLEKKEFAHFGGRPSLGAMLKAIRTFPHIKVWCENNFNIIAMIDLANPREEKTREYTNWKVRVAELEIELAAAKKQVEEQSLTITELRAASDEQSRRLGELMGQVKVLERYAPRDSR